MPAARTEPDAFASARKSFEEMLCWLEGTESTGLTHAELEYQVERRGREVQRLMLQDHLDLRALREQRVEVVDAETTVRSKVERAHRRRLATVVGTVSVERLAYRHGGAPNLHPADGALNLPVELHSHGLRRLAAIESTRGSFDDAAAAIGRATGVSVAKRQVESLTATAATDVEAFYATRAPEPGASDDVMVISVDGKGIVMRPDALRSATATAAGAATPKLGARLSKGEKRYRKRMAEVGAVYDLAPVARSAADVLASTHDQATTTTAPPAPAPTATGKWVTASVARDAADVVADVFAEADRRDPEHRRCWVALVDGNNHQIDRINTEAAARGVDVAVVIDLIHVMEYIWSAAWCFFAEGDPAAQDWVRAKTIAVLQGHARDVATGIRRRATAARLTKAKRNNADACANYLTNKASYLDYPTALAAGWPIATGIIEGTCRYLVADRMDITGARWSVDGAEAVLKLRAVRSNGDFDDYWAFHLNHERQRVHASRYANSVIPLAA
ncbi:MAG: ISKra4 family transposase [Actinomycetota bacterium]|nr:ISKra4 family transposase [Actinomycetota bacterium]